MSINLKSHFCEGSTFMNRFQNLSAKKRREQKILLWNRFVDSGLIGITEEDCSILPRYLPQSYLPEIKKTAYDITVFLLRLLNLPAREIKTIIPEGPIRDFLIHELEVLKFRPDRLVGSFRFDMAIVGKIESGNPPKLLEVNEIGFGGLSRMTYIQETMLELLPQLGKGAKLFDPCKAETKNFLRLGKNIARFQYDAYDWEEQVLLKEAKKRGIQIHLVSPKQLGFRWDHKEYPLLEQQNIRFKKNRIEIGHNWQPDVVQMGYSFELQDYLRAPEMYHKIVQSKTPQYSPFLTGLVASKSILVLLADPLLQNMLLGSSKKLSSAILSAQMLKNHREQVLEKPEKFVLKHVDGLGGEKVFFDDDLVRQLKKINKKSEGEWVAQERTKLNSLEIEGTLSRRRKVISDLGVFVQYDWSQGKMNHFEVGGFITRATNKTFKVNVSSGGLQIPVFFDKAG